jgi:hypothetical protein
MIAVAKDAAVVSVMIVAVIDAAVASVMIVVVTDAAVVSVMIVAAVKDVEANADLMIKRVLNNARLMVTVKELI